MTVHALPPLARNDSAAARGGRRASPVIERCGYLADETVFNFIRAGVEDAVTRLGITTPVYVCHSLGCFVGLDAASRQEGACVIAINMPASPWHGFARAAATALRMAGVASVRGRAQAAQFRNAWVYFGRPEADDLASQRLKQIRQRTNCYTAPRWQDTSLFLKSALLEHRRKGPHAPRVLMLQGDLDPIAPARDVARLQRRAPGCSVVTIRGAHVLPVTHPRDVVRAIEAFLAESR